MAVAEFENSSLYYQLDGPEDAPVLVFSNSLGTALEMWNAQTPFFSKNFRVLRYDTRGHGRSSVTPGLYAIEDLGRDVIRLLDQLDIQKADFCGISLGGMIGLWLGINAADRLNRLVLCNTAPKLGTASNWNERIRLVTERGMNAVAGNVVERWFTPDYRAANPAECTAIQAMVNTTPAAGYAACCAAVRDMDFTDCIAGIRTPVLAVSGSQDTVTPPDTVQKLAQALPDARLLTLQAAHLSNIEAAESFNTGVLDFLQNK